MQSYTRCIFQAKGFTGLAPSSKHCQTNFSTSWSFTNRSICNKVVFSMPLLHDVGGNRYGINSNRCITSGMDLRPSVCLSSNLSYSISSEEARTVFILEDIVRSSSLAQKPGFPFLLNLICRQPHWLPYRKDLVIDLSTNKAPPNICSLNLIVWPITGDQSLSSVFQKKHCPLFPAAGEQELFQGTTHAGISGQTGARNEVWTQLPFL